jgi:alkyl hydroperoxide reductase subunit AhpC
LSSAQGPEVGLEDFHGKKNVIVWFTKGMACPFCRSQMSQLSRIYGDLQKQDTEVLEVSSSGVPRARAYAKRFKLPFSYLCDPDYQVRCAWGLERRSRGLGHYVSRFVQGATAEEPPNDYGAFFPPLDEMRNLLTDDDMGFFIVDKRGVVRYALSGPYRQPTGTGKPQRRQLPSNEEIVREVAKCQASAGDAPDSSAPPA